MLKKINDWLADKLKGLKVTEHGYNVNKKLTRGAFLICLLLLGLVIYLDGADVLFGREYAECPIDSAAPCINPFTPYNCVYPNIQSVGDAFLDCDYTYLQAGESYGVKPSWLAQKFNSIVIIIMCFALLLNHLLYNVKRGLKNEKRNV